MRIQLSSFSWNTRATLGLNSCITTTGQPEQGPLWLGQALPTLSEIHPLSTACLLPYKLMSWRSLVYNITSPFYHVEMVENTLNILRYIFCNSSSWFLKNVISLINSMITYFYPPFTIVQTVKMKTQQLYKVFTFFSISNRVKHLWGKKKVDKIVS